MADIGKRIRILRKRMRLTQSQLAELVDLSEDSIGKIERGVNAPTTDTLLKIAAGLKITLSELLGETLEKAKSQHKALNDFMKYLKTKSAHDVGLIHKIAVMIFEKRKGR